jgi:glycine betaine/choline ABC-type transport system substrate-binding protein
VRWYGSLVTMRSPRLLLLVVLALLAGGCALLRGDADMELEPEPTVPPVRVGGGPDAEATLLAHVLAAMLEASDIDAEVVSFSSARDARQAIELGEVDLRPAYTGETWLETLGRADPPGDPRESYTAVRRHDEAEGLLWLRPRFGDGIDEPPANATFAFVVAGPPAIDADLRTMSQLAARLSEQAEARVCVDREFGRRPDGLRAVLAAYSVRSGREYLAADPLEAVAGVLTGDCLTGLTTATDGAAWAAGLLPLVDDLRVFPAFVPLPQLRQDAVDARPEIRTAVAPMAAQLTTALLGRWNAAVLRGVPLEQVAAEAAAVLYERAGRQPAAGPQPPASVGQ